jgi:outer membrane lipoprotein-sorting protein
MLIDDPPPVIGRKNTMLTSRTIPGAAVLLALAPAAAAVPSADEMIDNAVKAMGGAAIGKIESYSLHSEMTAPMGTMTGEVSWVRPGLVLAKQTMPGMGGVEMGSDGKVGWMKATGMPDWQILEGDQLDQVRQQAMHIRLFQLRQTLKEDFKDLEPRGETEFDGVPCYELAMKAKDEPQLAAMFFDAKTWLPRGIRVAPDAPEGGEAPAGAEEMMITFGDWKPVDKVEFFHTMNMTGGGMTFAIRYTDIEVNKVDKATLAMPEAVAERIKRRASRPPGAPMELEDFSGQVQQMIRGTLDGLPWDDAAALKEARDTYESQLDRLPGEFRDGMKYIIRKIDERLKELAGGE